MNYSEQLWWNYVIINLIVVSNPLINLELRFQRTHQLIFLELLILGKKTHGLIFITLSNC